MVRADSSVNINSGFVSLPQSEQTRRGKGTGGGNENAAGTSRIRAPLPSPDSS